MCCWHWCVLLLLLSYKSMWFSQLQRILGQFPCCWGPARRVWYMCADWTDGHLEPTGWIRWLADLSGQTLRRLLKQAFVGRWHKDAACVAQWATGTRNARGSCHREWRRWLRSSLLCFLDWGPWLHTWAPRFLSWLLSTLPSCSWIIERPVPFFLLLPLPWSNRRTWTCYYW